MNMFLESALAYARAGYSVLPVRGKIPLTAHGAHDADTHAPTIHTWWTRWPDANVAITLEGLVVVDIDPRNGGDLLALPDMPDTCIARTGGGGSHLLFRAAPDAAYPGKHSAGIDIKSGAGAYVVVAPSLHASGYRYAWMGATSPLARTPAMAPAWLSRPTTLRVTAPRAVPRAKLPAISVEENQWVKIRPLLATRHFQGLDELMIRTFHNPPKS